MPTVVQNVTANTGTGTSHNITITAATAGNTILVWGFASNAISSITDNGGATPTYATDRSTALNGNNIHFWYRRTNITDSPTQITVSMTSGVLRCAVMEVSGLDNTSPLGQGATGNTGGFSAAPSVTVTTATNNELALACFFGDSSRTWTAPVSGTWTRSVIAADASQFAHYYDNDVGTAGSLTCNPTPSSGTLIWSGMVTYIAASGASSNGAAAYYYSQL